MSTAREAWGSLRKLPSGRWQVHSCLDGPHHAALTRLAGGFLVLFGGGTIVSLVVQLLGQVRGRG